MAYREYAYDVLHDKFIAAQNRIDDDTESMNRMLANHAAEKKETLLAAVRGFQNILDTADGDIDYVQHRLSVWKESIENTK